MWSTFLTTLRINLREKSSLFWLFCFPILLSTMFLGMFGNLGATYEVTTMRFAWWRMATTASPKARNN